MRKGKAGAALMLSLMMGVSLLSGCSTGSSSGNSETTTEAASSSKSSSEDNNENKIYGIVSKVSSDSITINVGTLKKQNGVQNKNSSTEKSSSEVPAEKSMITTTGETKTITLTSSTKVSQDKPGNPPQGGGQPRGDAQQSSRQNGSSSVDNSSGNNDTKDSNSSEINSSTGGNSSVNGSQEQPPAKPEESGNSQSTDNNTDQKNNSKGNSDSNANEKDGSKGNSSDSSQSKELSVSDLKEDDEVAITLDSDGNASEISLLSGGGPGGENGDAPQGGGQSAAPTSYTSVTEYSKDKTTTGKKYSSTGTDGTEYVKGDSEYTITVSSYSTKADMSGMTKSTEWNDYKEEKPSQL